MSIAVDIRKKAGDFRLDMKFEAENEVLALLGASGCGKSMTLMCIAGVMRPDEGRICLNGRTLYDSKKGICLPPQKRRVGLVFQNYALFPNMTVRQNIAAGAGRGRNREDRDRRVAEAMERMGIENLAKHYPRQLSGGQQQRTALARALVSEPEILLLDEPLSALDSHLRFQIEQGLRELFREFGKTVLLVSHDRDEVYRMADKIAVLKEGRVDRFGEKREVFLHPDTRNGAVLTGCKNLSNAVLLNETHVEACDWGMRLVVPRVKRGATHVGIRMHDILPGPGENEFRLRIVEVVENPFSVTAFLRHDGMRSGQVLGCETDKRYLPELVCGREITVHIPPERILLLGE